MKERIDFITDSFIDYLGNTHHFVIAAVSQELPKCTNELKESPIDENVKVFYDVDECIEDYGTTNYISTLTKVLRLGVSICHPNDEFNEKEGVMKAVARARNSKPALFSKDLGTINTRMVKALLEQEAAYLKNNPNIFIKGYDDMHKTYLKNQEMENIKNNFSELENQVIENIQKNPKFLDNIMAYIKWCHNQTKGKK